MKKSKLKKMYIDAGYWCPKCKKILFFDVRTERSSYDFIKHLLYFSCGEVYAADPSKLGGKPI